MQHSYSLREESSGKVNADIVISTVPFRWQKTAGMQCL